MDGDLCKIAEDYFLKTNFMNRRIIQDIKHVRESYEDAWNNLNHIEKEQALNDGIIKPEVALKHGGPFKPLVQSFPKLRTKSGQKTVLDDDIQYRDEHSAPFSWKTRSEQDLRMSPVEDPEKKADLQVVAARRSAILSCPFGQYSRIPKSAKPVAIPVVPETTKTYVKPTAQPRKLTPYPSTTISQDPVETAAEAAEQRLEAAEAAELRLEAAEAAELRLEAAGPEDDTGSPFRNPRCIEEVACLASSIVISSEDNVVLDFSKPLLESSESTLSTGSSTPREESTLLGKMKDLKDRTMSLKRSLTPTMRRRKSCASIETGSTVVSTGETTSLLSSEGDLTPTRTAVKVARAVSCSRPSAPPPPPPKGNLGPTASSFGTPPLAPPSGPSPPTSTFNTPPLLNSSPLPPNSLVPLTSLPSTQDIYATVLPKSRDRTGPPPLPTRDPNTRISSRPTSTDNLAATDNMAATNNLAVTKNPQNSEITPVTAENSCEEIYSEIPKTGFDFLDNW